MDVSEALVILIAVLVLVGLIVAALKAPVRSRGARAALLAGVAVVILAVPGVWNMTL